MAKTAPKTRSAYVCSECGADHAKWQGQCDACGAWNTLSEIALETAAQAKSPASRRSGWAGKVDAPRVTALGDVRGDAQARASTGIAEWISSSRTGQSRLLGSWSTMNSAWLSMTRL